MLVRAATSTLNLFKRLVFFNFLINFCASILQFFRKYFLKLSSFSSEKNSISVILLAGGQGRRMQSEIPKQFLFLKQKKIAEYSFDLFQTTENVTEIIVVCESMYEDHFKKLNPNISLKFARPGDRRQDSVFNGLKELSVHSHYICIHDAARPFIDPSLLQRVFSSAQMHGAATVGMPIKFTIKEVNTEGFVCSTPDRTRFWEIQTPQVIRKDLLLKGFEKVKQNHLTVTDDVSVVEQLGLPVHIVEGDYKNIKITTPEDLFIAEKLIS